MAALRELADPERILLWDLDGTIIDSRRDLTAAVGAMLEERGLAPLSLEEVVRYVGRGARLLVARSLSARGRPADREEELDLAVVRFREHYGRRLLDHTAPYRGMAEILHALHDRGRPMALVSNKPEDFTRQILEGLGLRTCFGAVLGGDSLPQRKPSPEPLLRALELCAPGAEIHRAVLIGDSVIDVETARAAGARSCAVAWGFDPEGLLPAAGPDYWAATPAELGRALLGEEAPR